jgi:hypothetical protein
MYIKREGEQIENDRGVEVEFDEEIGSEENLIKKAHIEHAKYHWQAPEHEIFEKDKRWYAYAGLFLAVIIAYAVIINSPVMAITFILIGAVGYMTLQREPRIVNFSIVADGIVANRRLYDFDNIESFWIFYEPGQIKVISLHIRSKFLPYLHIPIGEADPNVIREMLLENIQEEKHEHSIVDIFERIIGI